MICTQYKTRFGIDFSLISTQKLNKKKTLQLHTSNNTFKLFQVKKQQSIKIK